MSADPFSDIRRGWSLPGDSAPVAWSAHAVERFGTRVRPGLDPDSVRAELCRLLATAVVSRKPPPWLRTNEHRAAAYLTMSDGTICLPLVGRDGELIAVTALMPDMVEGRRRDRRNDARSRRRAGGKAARFARKHEGGRRRQGPDAGEWAG